MTTDAAPTEAAPTKEAALHLMHLSMPTFEQTLDHSVLPLREECEKAGALTPERDALFAQYKEALLAARGEYEDSMAAMICDKFTAAEVQTVVDFFSGPNKVLEKFQNHATEANNIGTVWGTKVLERVPDLWMMLIENIGEWQAANTPADWETVLPTAPPSPDNDGWKRADAASQAEEYTPPADAA